MLVAKCDPAPLSYTKVGGSNPGFGTNKLITRKENIVRKLPISNHKPPAFKSRLDWEHRMCHRFVTDPEVLVCGSG